MQEIGCSGFLTHVINVVVVSILLLVCPKIFFINSFFKLLFETQPADVS